MDVHKMFDNGITSGSGDETIPQTADGLDMGGTAWVVLDFVPQAVDINDDGAVVHIGVAPDEIIQ